MTDEGVLDARVETDQIQVNQFRSGFDIQDQGPRAILRDIEEFIGTDDLGDSPKTTFQWTFSTNRGSVAWNIRISQLPPDSVTSERACS